MATQDFNFGVIGYGMSAKVFHIPFIQHVKGLRLGAILQRTPKPDNDASKDHPEANVYRTLDELLADKEIDAVVVTSTPETHYDIAKAALQAGKHVVVEKPFAPTSKECFELVQQAKTTGKLLTVYQNRRFDSDFLTLSSILPTLGRLIEFNTHFDRYRPAPPTNWKANPTPGNGVIYDLGSHLLDQIVHLFGTPRRVTGFVYSQREGGAPKGAEDSCTVLLHYESGMIATAKAGVISAETEQLRFWVRGEGGSYKKFGLDTQEDELKKGRGPADEGFGKEPEGQFGTVTRVGEGGKMERRTQEPVGPGRYVLFYEQLAGALRGEREVPVDAEGAANVIRVIELAKQSSKEGRTLDFALGEQKI